MGLKLKRTSLFSARVNLFHIFYLVKYVSCGNVDCDLTVGYEGIFGIVLPRIIIIQILPKYTEVLFKLLG